jgi:hypothetical protein
MPRRHTGEAEVQLCPFSTSVLEGGGWLSPCPGRFTPGKLDPVPIVQEAEGVSGPVWTGPKNLAQRGFEFRTCQPAASSYTNYAIPAPIWQVNNSKFVVLFLSYSKTVSYCDDSILYFDTMQIRRLTPTFWSLQCHGWRACVRVDPETFRGSGSLQTR